MAKGTLIFLFALTIIATLLLGINIGKKLVINQQPITNNQQPIATPSPAVTITPTLSATISTAVKKTSGTTTFTDGSCGFSFSYPGSYMKQNTVNGQSAIYADPDNPNSVLAATCASSVPRPPVSSDKIESVSLDGKAAILYHDTTGDGSPRDEVIVKHPSNGKEIILAGYGEVFKQVLASFKFIPYP